MAAVAVSVSIYADETRPFRMGFTPFPYDMTLEAITDGKKFFAGNADIMAQHMESIPWTEALNGKPFSKHLTDDWNGRRDRTPKNAKIYLALSPGRGDLAKYWGEKEDLPLPKEFKGKPFNDPLVKQAYLAYCKRAIAVWKPDFMCIGIEVNEIFTGSKKNWDAYAELHKYVYAELKKEHPKLPISASFTLHNLLNKGENKPMVEACRQIMDSCDFVAISFYPFIAGLTGREDYAFDWLGKNFDNYKKPYAIVETGEAAETLKLPQSGVTIFGTPEKQRAYFEKLMTRATDKKYLFVIGFLYRDYDALWEKIKAGAPELFLAWKDCGLVDEKGKSRPAHDVWRKHFRLPTTP